MVQAAANSLDRGVNAWKSAFAGLCTMAAVMGIGRFVFTPILPLMVESNTITMVQGGMLATSNFAGYLAGAILASSSLATGSRANWLYIGFLLSVITTASMAFDGGFLWFAIIRFFSGVASAFGMIFVSAIVFETINKAGLGSLRGLHFAGVGVGIAISSLLVSLKIFEHWQWLWLGSAAIALMVFPVLWAFLGERPVFVGPEFLGPAFRRKALGRKVLADPALAVPGVRGKKGFTAETEIAQQKTSLNDKPTSTQLPMGFWVLVISYGLFGFGYIITATFISAMAKSEPSLASVANWVWLVVGLSCIPAIWCWNRVADRVGLFGAYVATLVVEAVGVALSVTVVTPSALLISAAMLGGTFIPATAIGFAIAQQQLILMNAKNSSQSADSQSTNPPSIDPRRPIAIMTVAFSMGQMIGPSVAAWLFALNGDFIVASLVASAALILGAIIAIFASPRTN